MDLRSLQQTPSWEWPNGVDRHLLGILRDQHIKDEDRLIAVELAGDFTIINDSLAEALLVILGKESENESIRCQAALSLGPALEHADINDFDDDQDITLTKPIFHRVQRSLQELYQDESHPKNVRRMILESAVRSPQDWQHQAISEAYKSDDKDWKLTAIFCMRFIRGFDPQILEALESDNPDLHYQAICAAGNWGIEGSWPHIKSLLETKNYDRHLLFALIDAVASIRPQEAPTYLQDFTFSDDEEVAEAASESLAMAELSLEEFEDDDEEDTNLLNKSQPLH